MKGRGGGEKRRGEFEIKKKKKMRKKRLATLCAEWHSFSFVRTNRVYVIYRISTPIRDKLRKERHVPTGHKPRPRIIDATFSPWKHGRAISTSPPGQRTRALLAISSSSSSPSSFLLLLAIYRRFIPSAHRPIPMSIIGLTHRATTTKSRKLSQSNEAELPFRPD